MTLAQEPGLPFLEQFFLPSLLAAKSYHLDAQSATIKLDQNESPWDWPDVVKDAVLAKLKKLPWNRYPTPFADDLAAVIAQNIGYGPDNILLGPGSNYLIALVLQTFTRAIKGSVVLARPSFPLYENHCQYEGINYSPWPLNDQLEYDLNLMPKLVDGSLVVFASPNNPVGNVLSKRVFTDLLTRWPKVFFVADEAYCEFADEPYTELPKRFPNLLLIRTFSKTMGAAGLRLGYIVASAKVIEILKKPRVPFLLNQFTTVAATEVLTNPEMAGIFDQIVQTAISERNRVYQALLGQSSRLQFKITPSQANFLLLKWSSNHVCVAVYEHLLRSNIQVRNVSGAPGLAGCLRISIGTESENNELIQAFLSMKPI